MVEKIRRNAKPPERVAAAVERQLTRRRMRPRTLVGADARCVLGLKALLPARGLDAVWAQGSRSRTLARHTPPAQSGLPAAPRGGEDG